MECVLVSPSKSFDLYNTHSILDPESSERTSSAGQKTKGCQKRTNCLDCTSMRMLVPPGKHVSPRGFSPALPFSFMFPFGLSRAVAPDLNYHCSKRDCKAAKCEWRTKADWSKGGPREDETEHHLQIVMSERYGLKKAHPHTEKTISYLAPASGFISATSRDWPGDHTAECQMKSSCPLCPVPHF